MKDNSSQHIWQFDFSWPITDKTIGITVYVVGLSSAKAEVIARHNINNHFGLDYAEKTSRHDLASPEALGHLGNKVGDFYVTDTYSLDIYGA